MRHCLLNQKPIRSHHRPQIAKQVVQDYALAVVLLLAQVAQAHAPIHAQAHALVGVGVIAQENAQSVVLDAQDVVVGVLAVAVLRVPTIATQHAKDSVIKVAQIRALLSVLKIAQAVAVEIARTRVLDIAMGAKGHAQEVANNRVLVALALAQAHAKTDA